MSAHRTSAQNPQIRSGLQPVGRGRDFLGRCWMILAASIIFLIAEWPILSNWYEKYWSDPDGYYSHGMLVPFLSAYMIRLNIARLRQIHMEGSSVGLLLILISIPLYVLGLLVKIQLLCGMAFMGTIFGISMTFLGLAATRILLWPFLFLATMIPFADYVLDLLTLRCQLMSTTLAVKTFSLLGLPVQQAGNTILSSGLPQPLMVGIPCSGLKLLITLITCCWFLTYIIDAPRYKKAIVMATSLPLSIACNTMRITLIGIVGFRTYSESAMESFHDWSGAISILSCVALLYGEMRLLGMRELREFGEPARRTTNTISHHWSTGHIRMLTSSVALLLLSITAICGWAANSALDIPKGRLNRDRIPGDFDAWTSTNLEIDSKTNELLAKGDLLSRVYIDKSGVDNPVYLFVTATRDTRAFHDPLMCLPAAGNVCRSDEIIQIQPHPGSSLCIRARLLTVSQEKSTFLIVYWYAYNNLSWPDTAKAQVYMKRKAFMDAVHIMGNPFGISEIKRNIAARQYIFLRFAMKTSGTRADTEYLKRFINRLVRHIEASGGGQAPCTSIIGS